MYEYVRVFVCANDNVSHLPAHVRTQWWRANSNMYMALIMSSMASRMLFTLNEAKSMSNMFFIHLLFISMCNMCTFGKLYRIETYVKDIKTSIIITTFTPRITPTQIKRIDVHRTHTHIFLRLGSMARPHEHANTLIVIVGTSRPFNIYATRNYLWPTEKKKCGKRREKKETFYLYCTRTSVTRALTQPDQTIEYCISFDKSVFFLIQWLPMVMVNEQTSNKNSCFVHIFTPYSKDLVRLHVYHLSTMTHFFSSTFRNMIFFLCHYSNNMYTKFALQHLLLRLIVYV